jgi:N-glycosylase/DNA lyase
MSERVDAPATVVELQVPASELALAPTLTSGQVFRWHPSGVSWVGVVGRAVWQVDQQGERLTVTSWGEPVDVAAVQRFFRLEVALGQLYPALRGRQPLLDAALARFPGLRVICQPVDDALLSFAVASANHVGRIARSLDRLAAALGPPIVTFGGAPYFALPNWEQLAEADPSWLWQVADLGYRGRVLQRLGEVLARRPAGWLAGLATLSYQEAHQELAALPGVGPKIADCICLYGLGFDEAVPIDSHLWAIARTLFGPAIPTASLTPRTYRAVADLFRATFPAAPGWAQHYLFHARRLTPLAVRRQVA